MWQKSPRIGTHHRPADAQVGHREHVRPLELANQERVGAPGAHPLDHDQLGDYLLVGKLIETIEVEPAVGHVLGERAKQDDLGLKQTDGQAQLVGVIRCICVADCPRP
jgi:hypothetical protein